LLGLLCKRLQYFVLLQKHIVPRFFLYFDFQIFPKNPSTHRIFLHGVNDLTDEKSESQVSELVNAGAEYFQGLGQINEGPPQIFSSHLIVHNNIFLYLLVEVIIVELSRAHSVFGGDRQHLLDQMLDVA